VQQFLQRRALPGVLGRRNRQPVLDKPFDVELDGLVEIARDRLGAGPGWLNDDAVAHFSCLKLSTDRQG